MGESRKAIAALERVVRLEPNSAPAHLNLGLALADGYDQQGALQQFSEAVQLDPNSPEAHYDKGRALYDQDHTEEARSELRAAIRLVPEDPSVLYLLAQVERQLGTLPVSTELLAKLVQIDQGNSDAQFLLGQNLLRLDRPQDAIAHLKAAVEANPDNSEALYILAQTLQKLGSPEATNYLTRFQSLKESRHLSDRVQQLGEFGVKAASARNWEQAIAHLQKAMDICGQCSENATLHRDLGLIYCRKGDLDKGRSELKAALALKADDADARKAMEILDGLGKTPAGSPQ